MSILDEKKNEGNERMPCIHILAQPLSLWVFFGSSIQNKKNDKITYLKPNKL